MYATTLQQPFNSAQLELLQLFAAGISDQELVNLRQMLLEFRFQKVSNIADKILDAKGWTAEDLAQNAQQIKRTPYKAKQQQRKQLA
jgi:hypothetical protein